MKLLIIGGTVFVGRHLAEQALARGHAVTLFNRGRSNPDILPAAEHLIGDRNGDLEALRGRSWDAVVDTCGYHPREIRHMVAALDGAVGHYTFVSTLSVYPDDAPPGVTEASPVAELAGDPEETEVSGESYGPLKALCERELLERWRGAALVVRPGLIVGPYDRSDRFTYWPERMARAAKCWRPATPTRPCSSSPPATWPPSCWRWRSRARPASSTPRDRRTASPWLRRWLPAARSRTATRG